MPQAPAADPACWELMGTTYNIALFLHLLGALLFFAGAVVAGVAFELARGRPRAAEVAALLAASRVGAAVLGAGMLIAGVFGLWLVHLGQWGYGSGWVDWAIGLYVLVLVLGGAGGARPRRARLLATSLGEHAEVTPELRTLLDDPAARALNYVSLAIVIAIVALMVFK
jgi:uncharacterized membrane protein